MVDSNVRLLTLLSVKLVQPGLLGDVTEGFTRLAPSTSAPIDMKEVVRKELVRLLEQQLVCLYAERRYMLTSAGESVVETSGIRDKIETRRLFLLKETRKAMRAMRSGTRERSLQQ